MSKQIITVGELFAGIGGIGKGLEDAKNEKYQFKSVWHVENDAYAQAVLAKHWPDCGRWDDVRTFPPAPAEDWRVDLICGGFPCQPTSLAGKGLAQADERWLWPEVARIVDVLRPRFILLENPPGLLVRPKTASDVFGDLAARGYDAEWTCIPAAAMGAPHQRWRVLVVAHRQQSEVEISSDVCDSEAMHGQAIERGESHGDLQLPCADAKGIGRNARRSSDAAKGAKRRQPRRSGEHDDAPDTGCSLLEGRREGQRDGRGPAVVSESGNAAHTASIFAGQCWRKQFEAYCESQRNLYWPNTQPGVCGVASRIPQRVDRLRCLGNAVVPQVAQWIGERILESLEP
jgi:DNA (cytosine-5)-methyltransferase 1